ncbi:MAG: LuxR family transcriptional regulator [Phycisphaerae bacterium SM23_30]|nr:MAG: LuxR family transcriptional regulator [Phycisphaerae bacterium SM23_30]
MSTPNPIPEPKQKGKVLLVDDHPVVRIGLCQLINQEHDLEVCGEAENASAAMTAIEKLKPDVAVVDISLEKDLSGIELIKDVKARFPQVSVLVLSMHDESVYAERALRAGAKGYLMKSEAMETVLTAIREVLGEGIYLSKNMTKKMLSGFIEGGKDRYKFTVERLSDRELEVLYMIGQGLGTSHISEKMHLGVKTVETYRTRIKEKLGLADAAALVEYAIQWVHSQGPK